MKTLIMAAALAAATVVAPAAAQTPDAAVDPTRIRICTGVQGGNYEFAGQEIANRLGGSFRTVRVVHTSGSLDNMRRLTAGECDVGISQSDVAQRFVAENPAAMSAVTSMADLYREYVHLLCPVSAGWSRINDIGKAANARGGSARMIVGPDGSGTSETWRAMRQADAGLYNKIERLPDEVGVASLQMVRASRDTCLFWISGQNSPAMRAADSMSVNNPQRRPTLRLIDFNDRDIIALKGPNGRPLYERVTITRVGASGDSPGRYANLIENPTFGSGSVDVLAVQAQLIARQEWLRAVGAKRNALATAVEDALPTIHRRTNPN